MNTRESFFLLLATYLNIDTGSISESNTFDELGLDSMDAVDVVMQVEEKYDITVDDADLASFTTVGDALTYIENSISNKTQGTNMPETKPQSAAQEATINETEARTIIHGALVARGIKMDGKEVTKKLVDDILDIAEELSFDGLVAGKGIKMQDFMTIEVREHAATTYKVPDVKNPGQFLTGTVPAGKHVGVIISDKLKEALNASNDSLVE